MARTTPAPESGEDSDSEALFTRPNDKHMIDEEGTLLDEIVKQLKGKKKRVVPYPTS